MTISDTAQSQLTFLGPDESWVDDVVSFIEAAGYVVLRAESSDIDHSMANGDQPDVIIHAGQLTARSVDKLCDELALSGSRPLVMTLAHDTSQNSINVSGDVGADPAAIVDYVSRYLELRRENIELKRRIEKLTHAQEKTKSEVDLLRDAVVNNVAHELRTPLLQIKAAVSLLSEAQENDELLQLAKGATARLEVLVKNITMLNSSLDINIGPAIARDTIHYAVRNLGRIWTQKDAIKRIELDIEDNLPPIMADKTGLSTVIQLLADNALKFSSDQVIIAARSQDETIAISVSDSGIGISDDQITRIFEPFYQVDGSSTRVAGGTGIGLSLVRLILDKHGAPLEVKSKPGNGTSFCFYLPVASLRSD